MPEIERIDRCSARELWDAYCVPGKPVILTDLLRDFPARAIERCMDPCPEVEFQTLRHDVELDAVVRYPAWLAEARAGREYCGVANLPESFRTHTGTHRYVDELLTPLDRRVRAQGSGLIGFVGVGDGNRTHVDGWISGTLSFQVVGRKDWLIFPTERSYLLAPLNHMYLVDPMLMPLAERRALVERVGGYVFTVEAGETLYFPGQWGHATYYPEPSFGFTERFGRDLFTQFLSRAFPRHFYRHSIFRTLSSGAAVERDHWPAFLELHDAAKRAAADPEQGRYLLRDTLESLYHRLYPSPPRETFPYNFRGIADAEEKHLAAFYDGDRHDYLASWTASTGLPPFDWWREGAAATRRPFELG